jgi:hypothetical protein
MAKQLTMVENNEKGEQARDYFILKEEQANNQIQTTELTEKQQVLLMAKNIIKLAEENLELENTVKEKEQKIEVLQIENSKQANENQKLQITIKDFFKGADLFTRRQTCHFLTRQGLEIKEQQITDFLNKKRWLCEGKYNTNKATAESCRFGWFVNDIYNVEKNGRNVAKEYGKFTVVGLVGMYNTFKK